MVESDVERLLKSKDIRYRIQGSDVIIKCLNPEHDDSNPSLRIDRIRGMGQCFACGFKIRIFQYFGVITNTTNIKVAEIKDKIAAIRAADKGLDMLEGYTPISSKFRDISVDTLRHFDMFFTDSVDNMQDRIIVPIRDIRGNIKVFVGRHVLSDANPRYMIYPKKADMQLLPCEFKEATPYMVLVEGLFDMLNLYDKGLKEVVATLGTSTLLGSNLAQKLLPFKAIGVRKVFILFDDDNAGKEAATKIKPLLEKLNLEVEILALSEGKDPGDLSLDEVNDIKNYIIEQFK